MRTIQAAWERGRNITRTLQGRDPTLSLGSGEVDIVEVELPSLLAGRTVKELTLLGEIHVAALSREGRTFLPTLGTVFREGDLVHLVVLGSSAARLTALLGEDIG
jgi:trk system potassium uptake protein TrkA